MPIYASVPSLGNHDEATSPSPKNRFLFTAMRVFSLSLLTLVLSVAAFAQAPAAAAAPAIPGVTTLRIKSAVLGEERPGRQPLRPPDPRPARRCRSAGARAV